MKRIVLLLAVLFSFLVCENAAAQLNITAAVENKPEKLLVGQVSYSYLCKTGTGNYEYWANTDNQFDRHYTTLYLGNTPQSAIQTLNDLLSLMDKEVAGVNVQQADGDVILTYAKILGVKTLWIKQSGQGGRSWINYPLVEKFIKYFKEHFPEAEGETEAEE